VLIKVLFMKLLTHLWKQKKNII